MRLYYDLHIHTCLSHCADEDMTPCNIVGMAKLIGLDLIAITDHNSALNARAASEASYRIGGPIVIAGTELETSEGIHVVILFPSFDAAEAAGREIKTLLPKMRKGGYRQRIMDGFDKVIMDEPDFLSMPSSLGLYDVAAFADNYGAVAFPAHIDRGYGGILGVLGGVDRDMGFNSLEITAFAPQEMRGEYLRKGYKVLTNSDAHSLHLINEKVNYLEINNEEFNGILAGGKNEKQDALKLSVSSILKYILN